MKNILQEIISNKRKEVQTQQMMESLEKLKSLKGFSRKTLSLASALLDEEKTGIIAEFKRRSPSRGVINCSVEIKEAAQQYYNGGASAISVLTDSRYFGGSLQDLLAIRNLPIPLLRKDFIIDEYQIFQSKAYGADVILLIAACLTKDEIKQLSITAKELGLNVLLEIHDDSELNHICDTIDLVGINNRNLKTFTVDIEHSISLSRKLPSRVIKIAESGIDNPITISRLKDAGFSGFLIGEAFMKSSEPGKAFLEFAKSISDESKSLRHNII